MKLNPCTTSRVLSKLSSSKHMLDLERICSPLSRALKLNLPLSYTNFYVSRVRAEQGRKPQKARDFFWKINTWNFKIHILVSGNRTITLYILTYTKKIASILSYDSFSKTIRSIWPFWPRCSFFIHFPLIKKNFKSPRTTPHFSISRITVRLDTYQYQLQRYLHIYASSSISRLKDNSKIHTHIYVSSSISRITVRYIPT